MKLMLKSSARRGDAHHGDEHQGDVQRGDLQRGAVHRGEVQPGGVQRGEVQNCNWSGLKFHIMRFSDEVVSRLVDDSLSMTPQDRLFVYSTMSKTLGDARTNIDERVRAMKLVPLFVRYIVRADVDAIANTLQKLQPEDETRKSICSSALLFVIEYGSRFSVRSHALSIYAGHRWKHEQMHLAEKAIDTFASRLTDAHALFEFALQMCKGGNYLETEILLVRLVDVLRNTKPLNHVKLTKTFALLAQVRNHIQWQHDEPVLPPGSFLEQGQAPQAGHSATSDATAASCRMFGANYRLIDALTEFIIQVKTAPLKDSTRRTYESRIKQFVWFLCEIDGRHDQPMEHLTEAAHAFINFGRQRLAFRASTVKNYLRTLVAFASWSGGDIDGLNGLLRESSAAVREGPSPVLDVREVKTYIQSAKDCSLRSHLVVSLLLYTGMSIRECSDLAVSDVLYKGDEVQLRVGSGSHSRVETVGGELRQLIESWLSQRCTMSGARFSSYLFFGPGGDKLSVAALDAILRKIGWAVGLKVCARLLRNTYRASKLAAGGK